MSTPRVKRPFAGAASDPSQRQITSFFSARSSATTSPAAEAATIRSPPLPASVESNLLSVGMRVRKSVPEGYKVGGTSAFKLWTDNTPLPTSSRPAAPSSSSAAYRAVSRELLPFCGINKVGGLDVQPEVVHPDDDDDDVPALDDIPGLTMSQGSNDSSADSAANVRKRFFIDEADDTLDTMETFMAGGDGDGDGEISPRTLAPGGFGNARIMAIPRSRAAKRTGGVSPLKETAGQENMAIDGDFEEAEFLVYGEGREMDMTT
ncbi:hypothetical protein ACRE_016280 [Hapsidospora chrysogenum ATCC 11550]|uniref:Uncharacterized protein n=1 Tax=Hapsidospora chrysogenum (strain ATCC 11550 / CBS 779.69 / DSM 880 / IAM 14645 / JCM 23072 / IMI 49137) TaxID=857340 RepID=A0A086TDV4_HAPC1|nr:hypothetical protein ACRE_016280 [Hapsidospora chrysogenum ATCC 11550]